MIKKIKSKLKEIKKKMDERIEYVKECLNSGDSKIQFGIMVVFLGFGLIVSGVYENAIA